MQIREASEATPVDVRSDSGAKSGVSDNITDSVPAAPFGALTPDRPDASDSASETVTLLQREKQSAPEVARTTARIPVLAWPLLAVSLASVSSAGVVLASLPDVPTFTLAAWRLQTSGLKSAGPWSNLSVY